MLVAWLVVLLAMTIHAGNVELTSNKQRRFTCPGDQVTFTCGVFGSSSLEWRGPLITQLTSYTAASIPPDILNRDPFTASLIEKSDSSVNLNFTSTLEVNASRMFLRDETTVMCLSSNANRTDNFTVADEPAAPLNVTVNQVERVSGGGSVNITASWIRPPNFELFDIDRYDISVSSTSGVQNMTTACGQCTSTVITVSENPNNVQMNTTFTATIAAVNLCGENGPTATASDTLIDCGQPVDPQHGSTSYTGTTEGSEVFYSCNPGLVPGGRMRANCTDSGWSPNPAGLNCTEGASGLSEGAIAGIVIGVIVPVLVAVAVFIIAGIIWWKKQSRNKNDLNTSSGHQELNPPTLDESASSQDRVETAGPTSEGGGPIPTSEGGGETSRPTSQGGEETSQPTSEGEEETAGPTSQEEFEATKQELEATKQELEATKQELEATKQELEGQNQPQVLDAVAEPCSGRLEKHQQEKARLEGENKRLVTKCHELEQTIKNLEAKCSRLEQTIKNLESDLKEVKEVCLGLKNEMEKRNEKQDIAVEWILEQKEEKEREEKKKHMEPKPANQGIGTNYKKSINGSYGGPMAPKQGNLDKGRACNSGINYNQFSLHREKRAPFKSSENPLLEAVKPIDSHVGGGHYINLKDGTDGEAAEQDVEQPDQNESEAAEQDVEQPNNQSEQNEGEAAEQDVEQANNQSDQNEEEEEREEEEKAETEL